MKILKFSAKAIYFSPGFQGPATNDEPHDVSELTDITVDPVELLQRFLSLPRELRNLIYEHIFGPFPQSIILRKATPRRSSEDYKHKKFPPLIPGFCYSTRQIFEEAIWKLVAGVSFTIKADSHNLGILNRFLQRVPDDIAYQRLRSLRFASCYLWGGNKDIKLLGRCTGLQHLELELYADAFFEERVQTIGRLTGTVSRMKSKDEILRIFRLAPISEHPELKTLVLECAGAERAGIFGSSDIEDILYHMQEEIKRRGSKLDVGVRFAPASEGVDYAGWGLGE